MVLTRRIGALKLIHVLIGLAVSYITLSFTIIYIFEYCKFLDTSQLASARSWPGNRDVTVKTKGEQKAIQLLVVVPILGKDLAATEEQKIIEKFVLKAWIAVAVKAELGTLPQLTSLRVAAFVQDQQSCYAEIDGQQEASLFSCHVLSASCLHPMYSIPTMDCIFREAMELVRPSELLLYANGDMIFHTEAIQSIVSIAAKLDEEDQSQFVITGRRTEIEKGRVNMPFTSEALEGVISLATENGTLYSPFGLDYFVFPPSIFPPIFPSFLLGRWRWDSALLAHFVMNGAVTGICIDKLKR